MVGLILLNTDEVELGLLAGLIIKNEPLFRVRCLFIGRYNFEGYCWVTFLIVLCVSQCFTILPSMYHIVWSHHFCIMFFDYIFLDMSVYVGVIFKWKISVSNFIHFTNKTYLFYLFIHFFKFHMDLSYLSALISLKFDISWCLCVHIS